MSRTIAILGWLVVLSCAAQPAPRDNPAARSGPGRMVEPDTGRQLGAAPAPVRQQAEPSLATDTPRVARKLGSLELAPSGEHPAVASRTGLSRHETAREPEFVVWSERGGVVSTVWLSAKEGGRYRLHAQREGRWLSSRGTEWEIAVHTTLVHLPNCDEALASPRPGRARSASVEQLHASAGSRDHVLYAPAHDVAPTDASVHEISVIGRYLLAETREWVESCGAFSSETRMLHAWDLATWESVDMDYDRRPARAEVLADARTTIGESCEDLLHIGIGTFRPSLDGPTMLGEYAVTMTPGCDAFPEWTKESSHLLLRSPDLPDLMKKYVAVPAPVRAFIADTPDATPRGWSLPIGQPATRMARAPADRHSSSRPSRRR